MYMLPIAGQTAGPNGLKFVVVGVCQLFKKKKIFHGQHWALQLVVT